MSRLGSPRQQRSTVALDQIRGFPSVASPPRINTASLNSLSARTPVGLLPSTPVGSLRSVTNRGSLSGVSNRTTTSDRLSSLRPIEPTSETVVSTQTTVTSSSGTTRTPTVTTISDGQQGSVIISDAEESVVVVNEEPVEISDLPGSSLVREGDRLVSTTVPSASTGRFDPYYDRLYRFLSANQDPVSSDYASNWSNRMSVKALEHVTMALETRPTFILNEEGGIAIWYRPNHNGVQYAMITVRDTDQISELPYLHFPLLTLTYRKRLKKETADALSKITSLASYQETTEEIILCADRLSVILTTLDVILEYDQGWLSEEQAQNKISRRHREIVTGKIQADLELVRYFESRIV